MLVLHFISLFWRLLVCMKNKINSKFHRLIILIRTKTIHSHCGQVLRRESFFSFPLLIPSYPVRVPAACSRSPVDQLRLKHQEDRALLTRSTGTGRNPPHLQEDTQRHRQRQLTGSTPQAGQAERPRPTRYKAPHSLSYFFSLVNSLVNISC